MTFQSLSNLEQLQTINEKSKEKAQVIFKHSTRCSVSMFAKRILESEFSSDLENQLDVYYLDLISFREVSNQIASLYHVFHESPQLLLIKDGKCIYHASHSDVSLERALPYIS